MTKTDDKKKADVLLRCLYCKKERLFPEGSLEARGVFNFFCDGECEDRYAATL